MGVLYGEKKWAWLITIIQLFVSSWKSISSNNFSCIRLLRTVWNIWGSQKPLLGEWSEKPLSMVEVLLCGDQLTLVCAEISWISPSGNEALTGAEVPCALGIVLVLEHLETDAVTLTEGFWTPFPSMWVENQSKVKQVFHPSLPLWFPVWQVIP